MTSDYRSGASDMRRFRHKKRGTTYKVIGVGQIQSDVPLTDSEYVVIYQSEADGHFWARRMSEFEDGRFEELPADPASSECECIIECDLSPGSAVQKCPRRADPASSEGEAKLPPDLEIAEFKPCRLDLSDSGMAQWAFEDVANVANPAFPGVYHFIDEIRAMDDGRLVGIQFWGPPPKPRLEKCNRKLMNS